MSNLGAIRRVLGRGLRQAGLYKSATLVKVTSGTRTPGAAASGTNPMSTSYSCRGLISAYDAKAVALSGTLIRSDDRRITLHGGSLPVGIVPDSNDKVTIVDLDGVSKTFRIVAAPTAGEAGAAWICQGRK